MFKQLWPGILSLLLCLSGCRGTDPAPPAVTAAAGSPKAFSTAPSASMEGYSILVPPGIPPVIDGSISPGEWEQAAQETFADGSQMLLMAGEGYLYLGIRGSSPEMIIGNIFIDYGDRVSVLHASAALGTAIYEPDEGSWRLVREFDWCCRSTIDNAAAQAERNSFLQNEGWVATNARIGTPHELEYQIELEDEILHLAANYLLVSGSGTKNPWPKDLDDDCVTPTPGGLPEELRFEPDQWGKIVISGPD